MPTKFREVIDVLATARVQFIIIGGVAARAHGSARFTEDLDVIYRRNPENIKRLIDALSPYRPYPRGAPANLPFILDAETIRRGLNFTFSTSLGPLDLWGEVAGGGSYEDLDSHCVRRDFFGHECLCLDLPTLIKVKRAAGRPKDFEAIAELEALYEETANEQQSD